MQSGYRMSLLISHPLQMTPAPPLDLSAPSLTPHIHHLPYHHLDSSDPELSSVPRSISAYLAAPLPFS